MPSFVRTMLACLIAATPLAAAAADEPAAAAATDAPFATLPSTFTGTLPAASGPGIDWQLDLFADGSYQLRRTYLDQTPDNIVDRLGRWLVGSDERSLLLVGAPDEPIAIAIESPERLRLLDREMRPIESDLPYHLDLADVPRLEPELDLRGRYRYMADAALFDECLTGRRLPVAFVDDNLALERAYLDLQATSDLEPGEPVLAELVGRIAMLPPMDAAGAGEARVPTLEPLRFIALHPGETCPALFTAAALRDTEWQLTALGSEPIALETAQRRPDIILLPDEPRIAGFGGCNRLVGGFAIDGEQLRFSRMASTMMACPMGMELEQDLLQALEATDRFRVLGRHLDLYAADGSPVARFLAAAD